MGKPRCSGSLADDREAARAAISVVVLGMMVDLEARTEFLLRSVKSRCAPSGEELAVFSVGVVHRAFDCGPDFFDAVVVANCA